MLLTDPDVREAAEPRHDDPVPSMHVVVFGTAVKTLLATMAGLVLTCGLGLLVWAVTPSSGSGPLPLVRAGIAAFCAANGMTLEIGRSGLTLHPLMLTLMAVALLTTVSGRGRVIARGREQEGALVVTAALIYALAVTGMGAGFGGGTVSAAQWWRPAILATVAVGTTTLIRSEGWRYFLLDRVPIWVPVSLRCGGAGMAALLGGGAVTLVIGLIRTFGDSTTVQTLAAPGAAGGLGMALLGIAYLPNAVVAATGYSTGIGFTIGSGTYTPFGSSPVELPAVSLLTAAPDGHAFARPTLLLLLVPALAAVLIGRGVVRRLSTRNDRLLAAGGAAVFAAVLSAGVAGIAGGGVAGGEWSTTGVPPLLFGLVVLAALGVISVGVVVLTRVPPIVPVSLGDDETADVVAADAAVVDGAVVDAAVVHEEVVEDAVVDDLPADGPVPDDTAADETGIDAEADDDPANAGPGEGTDPDGEAVAEGRHEHEPDLPETAGIEVVDSSEDSAEGGDDTPESNELAGTIQPAATLGPPLLEPGGATSAIPRPRAEDTGAGEVGGSGTSTVKVLPGPDRPRRTI